MSNSLNQFEVETALYRVFEYGDISALANAAGKSIGYYSQMMNPEDPRESIFYRAAQDFHNLIDRDPERGKAALDLFCYFAKKALPGNSSLCIHETREKAFREDCEYKIAAVNGDLDTQIKELEESISADAEHLEALRGERRKQIKAEVFHRVEAKFGNRRKTA